MNDGSYHCMEDLLALSSHQGAAGGSPLYASSHSPLVLESWRKLLIHHSDRMYVNYILSGIAEGFRIGFDRTHNLQKASENMPSKVPSVISEYLAREVSLNRMIKLPRGVYPQDVHTSPLGAIPKKNKPGKWRLIVDLSSPTDHSINDGISLQLSSLSYASIDHLSSIILHEHQGCFLVKADIKEAYRMLPIHPEDQPLLGVCWKDSVYIDCALPFGLRSAPKIFSAVADAVQWILQSKGISNSLHYLDDFILVARQEDEATLQKKKLVSLFEELGVPLELSKLEVPSQCLTFLGIEVDTVALQLRLPEEKLIILKELLWDCVERCCILKKSIRKKDLQSLVGMLQFATKVVRPGRPFLRRLYSIQEIGSNPSHNIRLNAPAKADLLWWFLFIERWNGISILWDVQRQTADMTVFSDASGSWGCGAYGSPHWFSLKWCQRLQPLSIAIKELIPVIFAAAIWGKFWSGKIVLFRVDNLAVVEAINSTFCKDLHLMHLIRLLVFFAAHHNFWFHAIHLAGKDNKLADALSRNNISSFISQAPQALSHPSIIPPPLITLVTQNLTWTSISWMKLFKDTLQLL